MPLVFVQFRFRCLKSLLIYWTDFQFLAPKSSNLETHNILLPRLEVNGWSCVLHPCNRRRLWSLELPCYLSALTSCRGAIVAIGRTGWSSTCLDSVRPVYRSRWRMRATNRTDTGAAWCCSVPPGDCSISGLRLIIHVWQLVSSLLVYLLLNGTFEHKMFKTIRHWRHIHVYDI